MADCGATIQYTGQPKFTCTMPQGHKGTHVAQGGVSPVTWTASIAVIPPRKIA